VQEAKLQRLRRELENIRFKPGEKVDDFTDRLQELVAAMETLGEEVPSRKVVTKLLRVVPKSLSQVAVAIEITSDLNTLSLEDASGRLRAAEEREGEDNEQSQIRADGKLYMTHEQWVARTRKVESGEGSSSRGGSHGGRGRGRGRRGSGGGRRQPGHVHHGTQGRGWRRLLAMLGQTNVGAARRLGTGLGNAQPSPRTRLPM
jgi:uncharacterized membrane protein YgcG